MLSGGHGAGVLVSPRGSQVYGSALEDADLALQAAWLWGLGHQWLWDMGYLLTAEEVEAGLLFISSCLFGAHMGFGGRYSLHTLGRPKSATLAWGCRPLTASL